MQKQPSSGSTSRRLRTLLLVLGGLFVLYEGVRFAVRKYVDSRIEAAVGEPLVSFELQDLDGRTVRAADLRGKTVVLNFFRSRCSGCVAEAPAIRELVRRVDPSKVAVLGVMMDAVQGYAPEVTAETLQRLGYEHPIVMADRAFVDGFHGAGWANVTPVTYVVDPGGRIVVSLRGHQTLDRLLEVVGGG